MWDLVIREGWVIDPSCGWDAPGDLAIKDGKIAALGVGLPVDMARRSVGAKDSIVTPGLLDLHTHVWHGATYWGVDPEVIAWRSGVTTWIDAGSAGAYNISAFKRWVADRSPVRIGAFINVSGIGLVGETGEHHLLANLDTMSSATVARELDSFVKGVKVRMDCRTVGVHGLLPMHRALGLAEELGLPLMLHVGLGPPTVAELLPLLRAGDIVTHCASDRPTDIVDDDGNLSLGMREAISRGVLFDLGHGSGAFNFGVAERIMAAGVRPFVSTDINSKSALDAAFHLPSVMEKMITVGYSLFDVIEAATIRPAEAIGMSAQGVGTLSVGSDADVAVFDVEAGSFPVTDVQGSVRASPMRLRCTATYVGGQRLAEVAAGDPPGWLRSPP